MRWRKDKHARAADRLLRRVVWRHSTPWLRWRVWGNSIQLAAVGLMLWAAFVHEWRAVAVFILMDIAHGAWRRERARRSFRGVAFYDPVKASYFGVLAKKGTDPLHGGVLVFPRSSRDVACEVASTVLESTYGGAVEVVIEIHNGFGIKTGCRGAEIEVRGPQIEVMGK